MYLYLYILEPLKFAHTALLDRMRVSAALIFASSIDIRSASHSALPRLSLLLLRATLGDECTQHPTSREYIRQAELRLSYGFSGEGGAKQGSQSANKNAIFVFSIC